MKRRYRVLLNLFSFGLLLVALYLNFVKKEGNDVFAPTAGKGLPSSTSRTTEGQSGAYMPSDGTLVLR